MAIADKNIYMREIVDKLNTHWPHNKTINMVCHGHSVPAGYFATPSVDTFNAYPHLFHKNLKQRFPYAVINVIVTAIGGEHSQSGAERFENDVLCHKPSVVTIDYSLNDRRLGIVEAKNAWRIMIEKALQNNVKLLLLTPTWDLSVNTDPQGNNLSQLMLHTKQVRRLAEEYEVGLIDCFRIFEHYNQNNGDFTELMSWVNHPGRKGHELIASELIRWFPIY